MNLASEAAIYGYYEKACRLGKKEGGTLSVLDDILKEKKIRIPKEVSLGLVNVPIDLIVGTKTSSRAQSFSRGFYPIISPKSEFGAKWMQLCRSHIDEGIREPIKAYEFMNKYYVSEGNKRVSVLKFFDAIFVPAYVTRIIPPAAENKETRIYYEFMEFYDLSGVNYIYFSKIGSFAKLQRLVGKMPDEKWTEEDQKNFSAVYHRFKAEYDSAGSFREGILPGDAFLFFIKLYDYNAVSRMSPQKLHEKFKNTKDEFSLLTASGSAELQMDPNASVQKTPLIKRLIPLNSPVQKVAFIYEDSPETSGWTYSHELGRIYLDKTFADQVETCRYDHADSDNIENMIIKAVNNGSDIIFTTTSTFFKASLKAAIEYPKVRILNCSLNASSRHMRTYSARLYEVKFLIGAIAGAMAQDGKIGYLSDCPTYGCAANINAFAMGAKMVNPRAKIYLAWSCEKDADYKLFFDENKLSYISGPDLLTPEGIAPHFGLYKNSETQFWNIAIPVLNWGKFYEKIIRRIMKGSWDLELTSNNSQALNYWWGMSANVSDVICSNYLPIGTHRLIELLKQTISNGGFNPFAGPMYSQDGPVKRQSDLPMSPKEIIYMDWLAENVIGSFPKYENLNDKAKKWLSLQSSDYMG